MSSLIRALGVVLVLAALAGTSSAVLQGGTVGTCKAAGKILAPSQGPGRLDLDCAPCPGKACHVVKATQTLFKGEALHSKSGTISFYSTVATAPDFTCFMSKKTKATFYPAVKLEAPVVLKIESGAISCDVHYGAERPQQARANQAIFIYKNAAIRVRTLSGPTTKSDASSGESHAASSTRHALLFGVKVKNGSVTVQAKKGTIAVGAATGQGDPVPVEAGRQRLVQGDGSAGASTPLVPDPDLESAFLAVRPNLCEQNIKTAKGENDRTHPQGLAADRNGNLWFTDDGTPALGMYDQKSGKITLMTEGLNPGSKPRWIASDTKRTIWFTDDGTTPAIGMVDPTTHVITEYSVGLNAGSVPWAIENDRVRNLLWFTDQGATPAIGMINPSTKQITEYSAGLNPGSHPEGIAVDRKGNVWFTDDNDPRPAIGMLDPKTKKITEYRNGLVPGSLPRGIALGPDGNIWFADQRKKPPHDPRGANDGLIGKIDPTTHEITEYAVLANGGNPGSRPEGLAAAGGKIWFTDGNPGKPAIGLIKLQTGSIIEKPMKNGSAPMGIVVTPAGGLWFVNQQHPPKIGTLSAKSSRCPS